MSRLTLIGLGLLAGCVANAGQIQIGQIAGNTIGGANSGLTANYITGSGGAACVGQVYQGNSCASTSGQTLNAPKQFSEENYAVRLFSGAIPTPSPYAGYSATSTPAPGTTMSDGANNVNFAMISDGAGSFGSNNYWNALGANDVLTIPVGLFGVTDVWTMLNNVWGPAGALDTQLTFQFDSKSDGSDLNSLTTVTLNLVNSSNTPGGSGQIRSSVDCAAGSPGPCTGYANGPLAASSTLSASVTVNGVAQSPVDITVLTNGVMPTTAYSSVPTGNYAGSQGNVNMDDQGFYFGDAFQNLALVSIGVKETGMGTNDFAHSGVSASQTALSAITIDTTDAIDPTPEPSTIALCIMGLGALVVGTKARRNQASR